MTGVETKRARGKCTANAPWFVSFAELSCYQRVSIASYASAGIAGAEMSVCLSVTLRYCIKTKKARVVISSPSESLNTLVSINI